MIDITEADLRVLKVVIRRVGRRKGKVIDSPQGIDFSVEDIGSELRDLTPVGVKTYLARLQRLGLVLQVATAGDAVEHGSYVVTHLLDELTELVAETQSEQGF